MMIVWNERNRSKIIVVIFMNEGTIMKRAKKRGESRKDRDEGLMKVGWRWETEYETECKLLLLFSISFSFLYSD